MRLGIKPQGQREPVDHSGIVKEPDLLGGRSVSAFRRVREPVGAGDHSAAAVMGAHSASAAAAAGRPPLSLQPAFAEREEVDLSARSAAGFLLPLPPAPHRQQFVPVPVPVAVKAAVSRGEREQVDHS